MRQSVYICGIGEDGLTIGRVCGVAEKNSDWLGSRDWAPHKGSVDEHRTRICNKALISHGYK
jgi:hypothetical protein